MKRRKHYALTLHSNCFSCLAFESGGSCIISSQHDNIAPAPTACRFQNPPKGRLGVTVSHLAGLSLQDPSTPQDSRH
eukprot:5341706-Amphidinium_carterae.1